MTFFQPIRKLNTRTMFQGMTILLAFTMTLVPLRTHNWIIILTFLSGLIYAWRENQFAQIRINRLHVALVAFFLLQIVGVSYSINTRGGWKDVETMLPFVVFPVLLSFTGAALTPAAIRLTCYAFLAGILVTCFARLLVLLPQWPDGSLLTFLSSTSHSGFTGALHPAYLGLYVAFAILFTLDDMLQYGQQKIVGGMLIAMLVLFMAVINARMAIIGFSLVLTLYIFMRLQRKARWIAAISVILFLTLVAQFRATRERFIDAPLKVFRMKGEVDAYDQSSWPFSFRLQIYGCAIDKIGESPLFGYGTGGSKFALLDCYTNKNLSWMMSRKLNAHSEYFEEFLRHGSIGFLLLLAVYLIPLRHAVTTEYYLLAAFILLVMFSSLTESIFCVQKGTTFTGFFLSVLSARKWK